MKLILTQEVSGLGAPGDVVDVKDGYGRNYLMPRGHAIRWTRGAEKQIESIRRAREIREIRDVDTAEQMRVQLEALTVNVQARSGGGGRLFGAVTPAEIAAAIVAAGGPEVDKRRIEIGNAIKTVGAHQVRVRLHADVSATVDLNVVPA